MLLIFSVILMDMVLIYYFKRPLNNRFILTAILSVLGFLISSAGITRKESVPEVEEVSKDFKPGKFVASKSGTTYHSPKCDWAKKIKKKNQVWFDNAKDA